MCTDFALLLLLYKTWESVTTASEAPRLLFRFHYAPLSFSLPCPAKTRSTLSNEFKPTTTWLGGARRVSHPAPPGPSLPCPPSYLPTPPPCTHTSVGGRFCRASCRDKLLLPTLPSVCPCPPISGSNNSTEFQNRFLIMAVAMDACDSRSLSLSLSPPLSLSLSPPLSLALYASSLCQCFLSVSPLAYIINPPPPTTTTTTPRLTHPPHGPARLALTGAIFRSRLDFFLSFFLSLVPGLC